MNIEIKRNEIQNISELPSSFKVDILCAGVAFIGMTFLANAQVEVSTHRTTHYDMNKVYVGMALIVGSTISYTINKIWRYCFRSNQTSVLPQ